MEWSILSDFPSASHTCALLQGIDMQYELETAPCQNRYKFVCQKPETNVGRLQFTLDKISKLKIKKLILINKYSVITLAYKMFLTNHDQLYSVI